MITIPNLVLLRILFFRILHRGVLDVLLDLLASIDEGVDEEAKEEDDDGGQDGVEDEGHLQLRRNYRTNILLMTFFLKTWDSSS